jgi:hypothetical protein
MPTYHVMWETDVEADSYEEAARKAKADRERPGTTADVYAVTHPLPGATPRTIDLSELDGRPV